MPFFAILTIQILIIYSDKGLSLSKHEEEIVSKNRRGGEKLITSDRESERERKGS